MRSLQRLDICYSSLFSCETQFTAADIHLSGIGQRAAVRASPSLEGRFHVEKNFRVVRERDDL